jgi:threonine dehydrogenase-like Zn-dependent dehydrogenase
VGVDSAGTLSAVLAARRLGAERVIALSRYPDSQAAAAAAGWLGQLQYL